MTDRDLTLTTYDELAHIVESLPLLIRERRRQLGLSLRAAGEVTRIDFSTLLRIEQGANYRSQLVPVLLRWLADR